MTATPVQSNDARLRVERQLGDNRPNTSAHPPTGPRRASRARLWLARRPAVVDVALFVVGFWIVTAFASIGTLPAVVPAVLGAATLSLTARQAGFYRVAATDWRSVVIRRGALALAGGASFFLLAMYLTGVAHNRAWLPLALGAAVVSVALRAALVALLTRSATVRSQLTARVVLVGDDASITEFTELDQPAGNFVVVDQINLETYDDVRPALRKMDRVIGRAKDGEIDRIVLLTKAPGLPVVNAIIRRCGMAGVSVDLLTGVTQVRSTRLDVGRVHGFATVRVRPGLHGPRRRAIKRVFDLVVASTLLLVMSPVMVMTALAVKFDTPGPIFYKQSRLGRGGKRFDMIKFRSMVPGADQLVIDLSGHNEADGPLFKIQQDPRVTRVGRIIRKTSMDELPQLWNVIRGDMSLVGPRPAIPHEADGWPIELFDRLEVMPGITGLWQVSGRSDASFADYERLDLYYVDNWTIGLDLSILVRTLPAALGRGAY